MSYIINLSNVPVVNWRYGIEFMTSGCGNNAITTNGTIIYMNAQPFGCGWGKGDSWNFAYPQYLNHIFGNISGDGITFPKGTLETNQPIGSGQVMTQDYINFFTGSNSSNYAIYQNKAKPILASITYSIDDPGTDFDIPATIPNILIGYYNNNNLSKLQYDDYLNKYLFTLVTGSDGKMYPRIAFNNNNSLSQVPDYYKKLNDVIIGWQTNSKPDFELNLSNFCKSGGNINLIQNYNGQYPQNIPTELVTQEQLDKAYPNYSKYPNLCGCSMPTNYYINNDIMNIQKENGTNNMEYSDSNKIYQYMKSRGILVAKAKCNPIANCRSGGNVISNNSMNEGVCQDINSQLCVQAAKSDIGSVNSSGKNSNIGVIQQAMTCTQNVDKSGSENSKGLKDNDSTQPPSSPPSDSSDFLKKVKSFYGKNKISVIVGCVVIVILLLLLILI